MCESHAYLLEGDEERLIMEDVISVREEGGKLLLSNIIGEESSLDAEVVAITLLDHRILVFPTVGVAAATVGFDAGRDQAFAVLQGHAEITPVLAPQRAVRPSGGLRVLDDIHPAQHVLHRRPPGRP